MYFSTHKGMSTPVVIIIVLAIVVGGAVLIGRSNGSVQDVAMETANTAMEKGSAMLDEHGNTVVEQGKVMMADGTEKVVDTATGVMDDAKDTAMEEGKKMVGEALKETGAKMTGDADEQSLPGIYEDYTPEKVAQYDGAVVDFYAAWCPSCRALDKNITDNLDAIPDDVAILKVNYDTAQDLKQRYGVRQQHTLVLVDADGTMLKKWVGSPTLEQLLATMNQ